MINWINQSWSTAFYDRSVLTRAAACHSELLCSVCTRWIKSSWLNNRCHGMLIVAAAWLCRQAAIIGAPATVKQSSHRFSLGQHPDSISWCVPAAAIVYRRSKSKYSQAIVAKGKAGGVIVVTASGLVGLHGTPVGLTHHCIIYTAMLFPHRRHSSCL